MSHGDRLKAQEHLAQALIEQLEAKLKARGATPGDLICVLLIAHTYAELGAKSARRLFPKVASSAERAAAILEGEQQAIDLAKEFCDELRAEMEKEWANGKAAPTDV